MSKRSNVSIVLPNGPTMQTNPKKTIVVKTSPSTRARNNKSRRVNRRRTLTTLLEENLGAAAELDALMKQKLMLKGANTTRSGLVPNAADPRTNFALAQLGTTIGGRMAALKILHPNGESDEYTTKYPDGCANVSIACERRDEYKIEPPTNLPENTPWNCIIVEVPFMMMTQVAIRWPSTETYTENDLGNAIRQVMSFPGDTAARAPAWEQVTLTSGFMFEKTVLVATSITAPYINSLQGIGRDIKSIRRTYLGSTIDLDASDLYNQGRVVAGQWKPDVVISANFTAESQSVTYNTYTVQVPAYTINQIVQSDELCYQGEAKCGLYIPCRVSEMEIGMTGAQEWRLVNVQLPSDAPSSGLPPGSPTSPQYDLWLRGWMIGVSYWSDLDPHASLRIKRKEGLEFISAPPGVYAPFSSEALPLDLRAQQIIQEFSRKEPHGYTADHNSLGTMLQNIVGGIAGALGNLGIPVISDIANTVGGVVKGGIGNTVAGLLDKIA